MEDIKTLRKEKKLTQGQAAKLTGISLRTYKTYENDETKKGSIKHNYIINILTEYNKIDEEHGILELEDIIKKCVDVFSEYSINYCYLFGSYAKGTATPFSDVDLLVSSSVTGLKFFGMVEDLKVALKKKVDVLDEKQLDGNFELVTNILRDGIKIYG